MVPHHRRPDPAALTARPTDGPVLTRSNSPPTNLGIEQTSPVSLWITRTLSTDGRLLAEYAAKRAQLGFMISLVAVGVLILSALSIVCFAAYKIRAKPSRYQRRLGRSLPSPSRSFLRMPRTPNRRATVSDSSAVMPCLALEMKSRCRTAHSCHRSYTTEGAAERGHAAARNIDIFEAKSVPPTLGRYRQGG